MILRALICILTTFFVPKMGHAALNSSAFPNWTFDCEAAVMKKLGVDDPYAFNMELLVHAETAARQGLSALSSVNSELAKIVLSRWKSEKLTFHCLLESAEFKNTQATAFFDGRNPLDMRINILPLALREENDLAFQSTLLHELLHFAGLDNVSATRHTYHPFNMGVFDVGVMTDVIYACTAQAYPVERALEVRVSKENPRKGLMYSRSKKTCEVCALARPISRWKTELRTDSLAPFEARDRCAWTEEVPMKFQPILP